MTPPANGELLEERLTHSIIGAFFEVHKTLGYGFRERIYSLALQRELLARGHHVAREVAVTVYYRGEPLARQMLDMVADDKVVVLLLHFGRVPRFHRVVFENRLKQRGP